MKERLLLHCCCGPCSAYPISSLIGDFVVEAFYSNSNIDTVDEYNKRLSNLKLLCGRTGVSCIEDDYEPENWFRSIAGLENEPERGARCKKCYEYRMRRTFEFAKKANIKYITTTLTVAPYKDSKAIFNIASKLSDEYGVGFLELDFKKNDGYMKTKELAKEHGLYIQDYCGCIYSLKDRNKRMRRAQ